MNKGYLVLRGCQWVNVGYLVVNIGSVYSNGYNPGIDSGSF